MDTQPASQEAPAPKATKGLAKKNAATPTTVKTKPSTKAIAKPRPAKPSIPLHAIRSGYTGESDLTNMRPTKTVIDFSRFGTSPDAKMTDRDIKSLQALVKTFKSAPFTRANLDAGVIRRLGERGLISHVAGSNVAPEATFKLTTKGLKAAA